MIASLPVPLDAREKRTLIALVLATLLTGVLVLARIVAFKRGYTFLAWNLFLAWVPLLASLAMTRLATRHWAAFFGVGLVWLAFFPNAPYVVTDLLHLRTTFGAPLWLDVLIVGCAAGTGMLLALVSLAWVHESLDRRYARPRRTWCAVVAIIGLAALGVYLGRFQRWNSWDILTKPDELVAGAIAMLGETRAFVFVPLFALALLTSYIVFRLLRPRA